MATATWTGASSGDWQTAGNWSWSAGGSGYPGQSAVSYAVVFNSAPSNACVLSGNLPYTIESLTISYNGTVTLGGNVIVTDVFTMSTGTLSISSGKTLYITNTSGSTWSGGTISGAGTLSVDGCTLAVSGDVAGLGANLVILGSGMTQGVVTFDHNYNLPLTGTGNGIDVQENGRLALIRTVGDDDALDLGGITGDSDHPITISGGTLDRGKADTSCGGKVLVSCPIIMSSGLLRILFGESYYAGMIELHATVAGASGYSIEVTGGKIEHGMETRLVAASGVRLNGSTAFYAAYCRMGGSSELIGSLVMTTSGGILSLVRDGEDSILFTITGSLTCSSASSIYATWDASNGDLVFVTGTVALAGLGKVWGDYAPEDGVWQTLIAGNTNITGTFSSLAWDGHSETLAQRVIGSTPKSWQLCWTS